MGLENIFGNAGIYIDGAKIGNLEDGFTFNQFEDVCFAPFDLSGLQLIYQNKTELQKIDDNIDKVIFNDPATVILWKDGTKTIVKAQDDEFFDEEKGFALAILKYLADNKGNFNELLKKYCNKDFF